MKREKITIIEMIEILNFKHKMKLTRLYKSCKMEVIDNYLYIERWKYE